MKKMTEDEFYEKFNRVQNHIDTNASFDGCMFETYDKELEYVKSVLEKTPKRVWTILDCDGKTYYASGYHHVNRLGYIITEEEFDDDIEVLLDADMYEGKYQCGSCEYYFDEPVDNCCPHCGSGDYVEGCIDEK